MTATDVRQIKLLSCEGNIHLLSVNNPENPLSIFLEYPPSTLRSIFSVALVPVKLLLETGLGITDAPQCAQRSLECLTADRADSDRWNAPEILNDPKRASCHVQKPRTSGQPLLIQ
jgi:hypothetical protein